jgi:hypothetical protein
MSSTDKLVKRRLDFQTIHHAAKLRRQVMLENVVCKGTTLWDRGTNQSINLNKHSGLGVLGRQDVAVDGNSPTLVHPHLGITQHSIDHWGQLWSQQKDVDTAVFRDEIQIVQDGLFKYASGQVTGQVSIDINCDASLQLKKAS